MKTAEDDNNSSALNQPALFNSIQLLRVSVVGLIQELGKRIPRRDESGYESNSKGQLLPT